jgi:predicted DNA-binding transcriptional regulator AlpA
MSALLVPMTMEQRLKLLLAASPEQIQAVDSILEGKAQKSITNESGPLLLGMNAAARFLGVSRTTLWRMIGDGRLHRIEVLPGSFRVRRVELESVANTTR